MKVIFLDIDGVLNSDEYFEKINNLNVNGIEKEVDVISIIIPCHRVVGKNGSLT